MPRKRQKTELMQGTLDLLILRTLRSGAMHGYAIAEQIQQTSTGALHVEEGSLYPALHRMERRGWIEAEWGLSQTKRKAKYYRLTNSGRAQLKVKMKTWQAFVGAIASVLGAQSSEA
ncbi:MAG TPA: PadR family transcriptional regulator [Lacipirellulaceae bacterium]|nr:PadR family transcriptional regulator [Lacipirellulaceae bacterium]